MRCETHDIGFTLYPPAFAPYGRKPIAPVGPDGSLLVQSDSINPFEGTYFDAAIDARDKRPWPSQSLFGSLESRFRTQQRHMDRAALLLGIDSSIDERQREQIAHILSIPGQVLHDNAILIENQHSYSVMGDGICSVLNEIPLTSSIFMQLARSGAIAGVWPLPLLWDRNNDTYRRSTFQPLRTRASPG
ncbi:MAG: hypothetical protein GY866_29450 [Proteobacteria bacterium]|nr:hypothetical protein [Pseudomonadota bacterium]